MKRLLDFNLTRIIAGISDIIAEGGIQNLVISTFDTDKFFAGSYSSAQPGKAHLRNSLKSSVAEKIFFAGEAISSNYATVHGADLSGKDTALKVIEVLKL